MRRNKESKEPVEYDSSPAYFLRIESDDGDTESLPYMQLGLIQSRVGSREGSRKITLSFGIGIVEIEAENADHLLKMLEDEKVRVLRRGMSEDEQGSNIVSVRYISSNKLNN